MTEVIRYKSKQTADGFDLDGKSRFPEDLLGVWHIIGPTCDYTVCGHATDEYDIEKKQGKVTCKECLKVIDYYKKLRL